MADHKVFRRAVPALALTLFALLLAPVSLARPPDGGGGREAGAFADDVSPALWAKLSAEATRNEAALRKAGRLPAQAKVSGLRWPLSPLPGVGGDWHGISNFVDLDSTFPDHLRDYTCGTRTYDNTQGYNHRGTDIFIWPYPWATMDDGVVDIVAAAPGTIVGKDDGNDDRSCSFNAPDTPNYVLVRHADGTIALYLHMKRNSVTSKAVGADVVAGEYLGKVGSSGISTGPHLHIELRASTAVDSAVIDPFNGQCNPVASAWTQQRAYYDSRLNRLATHSAAPVLGACPNTQDQPNFTDRYQPGDTAFFTVAYHDQTRGQQTQMRVLRPDGSVYNAWTFDMADVAGTPLSYSGSMWYFEQPLPSNAESGVWTFTATFQGETRQVAFNVGPNAAAIADPRGLTGAWFEAATSGQGMEFHWIEPERLLVLFYGHHDNGQNFYVIGTHDGRFDYGETISVPLQSTRGGRYNGLDPAQIVREPWGTVQLRFDSCNAAHAVLTGTDGTQTLNLVPLTHAPGLRCD